MRITRMIKTTSYVWMVLLLNNLCIADSKPTQRFSVQEMNEIKGVAFSKDNQTLVTYGDAAVVWDRLTLQKKSTFRNHTGLIHSVAFSPDGSLVATGAEGAEVRVWNIETGEEIASFRTHSYYQPVIPIGKLPITALAFTPDGKQLLTLESWGYLQLWDLSTQKNVATIQPSDLTSTTGGVNLGLTVFADGDQMIIRKDHLMILFSLKERKNIREFEGSLPVYLSESNQILVARGDYVNMTTLETQIVRFDLMTGEIIHSSKPFLIGRPEEGIIHPDGKYLFLRYSQDVNFTVYDVDKGESVTSLEANAGEKFTDLNITPDGQQITAVAGNSILFWDVNNLISSVTGPVTR